ncbi:MAG: hypothetical protein GY853_14250 [PVC group bacterium]|nr:hypothetical protein [PVC group bacterium]
MKPGKKSKNLPFIGISRHTLKSKSWRDLSSNAKVLYLHLKNKFVGYNNGEISLHYSEVRGMKGLCSDASISSAFKELIKAEYIVVTNIGGLYRRDNRYEFTFKHEDYVWRKKEKKK